MHNQFSQILATLGKSRTPTPEPNAPTLAIITSLGITTCDPSYPNQPSSVPVVNNKIAAEEEIPTEKENPNTPNPETYLSSTLYHPSNSSNVPFPSRLKKHKKDDEREKFLSISKHININLPFLAASSVNLIEECLAVIQKNLPQKKGDTGSFTLPCLIITIPFKNALGDLGASINLMPHPLFFKLGISELKSTRMSIQLADRSIKYPIDHDSNCTDNEEEDEAEEVQAVSFYLRKELIEPLEWKVPENRLKSHKKAIAWGISDIKGLDPSFCTHKILMEEVNNPYVQPQRRLNLNIKEVMKKEVIKLLDAGIIYLVSYSPWVGDSFDHCLSNLDKMLTRCEKTNLVLNWEKCHFMVKEGIVLGHKISPAGIEVRIRQKSQENHQKRANTDTMNGRAQKKPRNQAKVKKSTLVNSQST
ncbi:reverse transcriptase domain-containing protein [Tanacetum coccineum]